MELTFFKTVSVFFLINLGNAFEQVFLLQEQILESLEESLDWIFFGESAIRIE